MKCWTDFKAFVTAIDFIVNSRQSSGLGRRISIHNNVQIKLKLPAERSREFSSERTDKNHVTSGQLSKLTVMRVLAGFIFSEEKKECENPVDHAIEE